MSHEPLRTFLAGRDVPCPVCGYNLRDLEQERCPECGTHVDLGVIVALDRSFHARRRAAIVSVCVFGAFMVGGFVITVMTRRAPLFAALTIPALVIACIATVGILACDKTIYEARAGSARARTMPSFARITWTWAGALALGSAGAALMMVMALFP